MAETTPSTVTAEPSRVSIRLPRPLWIGLAMMMAVCTVLHLKTPHVSAESHANRASAGIDSTDDRPLEPESYARFAGKKAGEERDDNGLKMKFVWCPAGEFLMGSPDSAQRREFKRETTGSREIDQR